MDAINRNTAGTPSEAPTSPVRTAAGRFRRILAEERGAALVVALLLLAVMSIFGALAINSSSTELKITGNFRASQEAYYAAERAVEYASSEAIDYAALGTGIDLENTSTINHPAIIRGGTDYGLYIEAGDGDDGPEDNRVTFMATGQPPLGKGFDPESVQANYYLVTVTGEGARNSLVRVESQVARIIPKPE